MLDSIIVAPGTPPNLSHRDTGSVSSLKLKKEDSDAELGQRVEQLELLQGRLFAENARAVLLVLQGMDTSGKDGTIKNVFRGVTPAAIQVMSFKAPVGEELDYDYLWRVHARCPERGRIGIFNRSHYEDVVAARVRGGLSAERVQKRFGHINDFERLLTDEGTTVVKCFLHLSEGEQAERFRARIDNPEKRWKFRMGDLDDRLLWDQFEHAYEQALAATSTADAPWYVVPADRKWLRNVVVAEILVRTLERMAPVLPAGDPGLDDVVVT